MNFETLDADVVKILPVHYTVGRQGSIKGITIHHNAGNLTVEQCYNVWLTREASAHYQVESSGRIGQLVWDNNTAWHAGNWWANNNTVGIEHADFGDGFTDECIENGAHLVAAICKYYGLGRPQWKTNVFPHSFFSPTACPAGLASTYLSRYMERACAWYDEMTGQSVTPSVPIEKIDTTEQEADMLCVVPDELNAVFLVAGDKVKYINHPDSLDALNQVYNDAYGKSIPTVRIGTQEAPYGFRFMEAYGDEAVAEYRKRAKIEGKKTFE